MPKRRSSGASYAGGISGGAGIGAGGGAAGAGRPAGGPAVPGFFAGPYEVESYSPTRRRAETLRVTFVSPNEADVASGSGNVYRVTRDPEGRASCTCMDFRVRGRERPCRHIHGFEAALSGRRMAAAAPEPAARPTGRRNLDASRLAEEARRRREEAAAAAQAAAAPLRDHEVSLADDATFQELLARASRGDLPYEYENVLDGSDNTFGIEIEFEGGDRRAIARELYERGYIPEPRQGSYHSARRPGMWSFESDASVSGGEIVSPVFRDTPEAWRQIEEVCEIVRRHGGRATPRCGGHVHIGNVPLDHDPASWQRLTEICRRNEDLIYRIAAGGESGGNHRGTNYAVPLTRVTSELQRAGHYAAANGRQHTVEFRYFNGTLDPRQWQANIRLAHALVRAAGNPNTPLPEYRRPLGTVARIGGDENHSLVRNFLDAVFTRARDKAAVLWLYATSRWQAMTA